MHRIFQVFLFLFLNMLISIHGHDHFSAGYPLTEIYFERDVKRQNIRVCYSKCTLRKTAIICSFGTNQIKKYSQSVVL
jgi:hypothetical protein